MNAPHQQLTPEILVPRIGQYLVEKGVISNTDLEIALKHQKTINRGNKSGGALLGQTMIDLNMIDRETLDEAITEQIIKLREALQQANTRLEERVRLRTIQLQDALHKLSELDRMKTNFISNISHELRTPLTHIQGYSDLLIDGALGSLHPEQQEALQVMERSTRRLEGLVEDLILFSMIESDQSPLDLQPTSLIDLLTSSYERAVAKGSQNKIQVAMQIPPDMPRVLADQDKITWVVNQLLDNAIKFTNPNGEVLLIASQKDCLVRISVSDTGIGIPEDKIDEAFQPFHQLDGSSTRKYSGTGLGLSLAGKIIKSHGSSISVVSQVGEGSQFYFHLNPVPL
jgi:signal transduction histidine kinase